MALRIAAHTVGPIWSTLVSLAVIYVLNRALEPGVFRDLSIVGLLLVAIVTGAAVSWRLLERSRPITPTPFDRPDELRDRYRKAMRNMIHRLYITEGERDEARGTSEGVSDLQRRRPAPNPYGNKLMAEYDLPTEERYD